MCCGEEGMKTIICFQGHVVDGFIYFSIQSVYVAETFGTLANSPSLF